MSFSARLLACFVLTGLFTVVAGCNKSGGGGGGGGGSITDDLKVFGRVYNDHIDAHRQGPAGWDEMITFAAKNGRDGAIKRVQAAGYQVKWGAKYTDAVDGVDKFFIAESPGGGPKLTIAGSVIE